MPSQSHDRKEVAHHEPGMPFPAPIWLGASGDVCHPSGGDHAKWNGAKEAALRATFSPAKTCQEWKITPRRARKSQKKSGSGFPVPDAFSPGTPRPRSVVSPIYQRSLKFAPTSWRLYLFQISPS